MRRANILRQHSVCGSTQRKSCTRLTTIERAVNHERRGRSKRVSLGRYDDHRGLSEDAGDRATYVVNRLVGTSRQQATD